MAAGPGDGAAAAALEMVATAAALETVALEISEVARGQMNGRRRWRR